ncbi:MAG: flagellar motor protein [Zoogloeaceae bacterium]|jgi:chemotaxis protein MotA|nr:flagellar motor protein [Zoogloeaceae bacterium]
MKRWDKLSILGLIIGIGAILGGQMLEGGHASSLWQPAALMIVLGGTTGAVLLQSPFVLFRRGIALLSWVFRPPVISLPRDIQLLLRFALIARREGFLALEHAIPADADPFVQRGLQLLVDGIEPAKLRDVLEAELTTFEDELRHAAKIWDSAGGYSPTIGILGAVLGLIHVMDNLADPAKLGLGIATAFVATVYGVGLANLVYIPIANKLKTLIAAQVARREMLIDGIAAIAVGENPRIIESRLTGYLPQKMSNQKAAHRAESRSTTPATSSPDSPQKID